MKKTNIKELIVLTSFSSTVTNILVPLIGGGIMLGGAIGASEIGKRIANVSP